MDNSTRKSDYEKSANEYWRWKDAGDNLCISARILEQHYQNAMNKIKKSTKGRLPPAGQILSQIIYLKAEGLELYIKALFIKQDNIATNNGKLNKILDTHNLLNLFHQTNISSDTNKVLLNKLNNAIVHWGKYPVPKEWSRWRPNVKEINGIQPVYVWLDKESKALDDLIFKVKSML